MFDVILEILFSILDVTGSFTGKESKSVFIRTIGIIFWLFLIAGIFWLIIK